MAHSTNRSHFGSRSVCADCWRQAHIQDSAVHISAPRRLPRLRLCQHWCQLMGKRKRELDDAQYEEITVRCKDASTGSSHECRVTRHRLLLEGDISFFGGFLRFQPTETVCTVHIEECMHDQFVQYMTKMNVVGGKELFPSFSLSGRSSRDDGFNCIRVCAFSARLVCSC